MIIKKTDCEELYKSISKDKTTDEVLKDMIRDYNYKKMRVDKIIKNLEEQQQLYDEILQYLNELNKEDYRQDLINIESYQHENLDRLRTMDDREQFNTYKYKRLRDYLKYNYEHKED